MKMENCSWVRFVLAPFVALLTLQCSNPLEPVASSDAPTPLRLLGSYSSGAYDKGGSEIAAYDPASKRLFVVNGASGGIDVLNIQNPESPTKVFEIDQKPYGASCNSVAVHNGVIAVAVQAEPKTDPGKVAFFDSSGKFLAAVPVGALPDMVTFTPDGRKVLVANEGEPSDDYKTDPEGSVGIIDVSHGYANLSSKNVRTAGFTKARIDPSVRIFGPGATAAQDLEPEYIAVSKDSKTSWVTLQENNAVARIDIERAEVVEVYPLGAKDHAKPGNELGRMEYPSLNVVFENRPILGMYQPDGIAAYQAGGKTYLVTANEGDVREWGNFKDEAKIIKLKIAESLAPQLKGIEALLVSKFDGAKNGVQEKLYSFGGRSFSIWSDDCRLVFDSGSDFERITAKVCGKEFNSNNTKNQSGDGRTTKRGPEPEGVALGVIGDRTIAFVGLERIGGVMVYEITDPKAPVHLGYVNNRNFEGNAEAGTAGDLGPEGLLFIEAEKSPTGKPLLVVANEVSGTTSIFEVTLAKN